MHIPDGYLSPQTCAAAYVVAVPAIAVASRRVQRVVATRNVPLLAMFSAVSFLVMMLNIPIPGGTTAHAVGGVLIAIALGPAAAIVAVAVALLLQALLFGDGGVLAYGANVLALAIVGPLAGYGVYRLVAGRAPLTARRRIVAAGVGGFVGINASGVVVAVLLGIQPLLFRAADGTPLYAPYSLGQALTAILAAHLTLAGFAEAALTAGGYAALARNDVRRLVPNHPGIPVGRDAARQDRPKVRPARLAIGTLAALTFLTPLGLLATGTAFAEEAPADLDLAALGLRAVPAGMARWSELWRHAPLPDYAFAGGGASTAAYLLAALVGLLIAAAAVWAVATFVARGRRGGGAS